MRPTQIRRELVRIQQQEVEFRCNFLSEHLLSAAVRDPFHWIPRLARIQTTCLGEGVGQSKSTDRAALELSGTIEATSAM